MNLTGLKRKYKNQSKQLKKYCEKPRQKQRPEVRNKMKEQLGKIKIKIEKQRTQHTRRKKK